MVDDNQALIWPTIDTAPRRGPVLLLLGETIPDMPNIRVGSYICGAESEELGYREYAKYGAWLIWNDGSDWFAIDVADPIGWSPLPQFSPAPTPAAQS